MTRGLRKWLWVILASVVMASPPAQARFVETPGALLFKAILGCVRHIKQEAGEPE